MVQHFLIERMQQHGSRPIIIEDDKVFTFDDLLREIASCDRDLSRRGIGQGAVVAILSDYNFQSVALFLALLQRRAIIVPIAATLASEVDECLVEAYVDWVASFAGATLETRPLAPVSPPHHLIAELRAQEAAGLILFSSGSTGKPKAMLHNLTALVDTFQKKPQRPSTILVFLMFDHIGGINTLFHALASGATMVLPGRREPERVCALVEKYRVTVLPTSPTFLNLILLSEAYRSHDLSSLTLVTYGTEPMPETLLLRLQDVFPKAKFLQTFGTSETGIAKTASQSSTSTFLRIDDPNIQVRIVDGELWLKSGTQILGYLNASMDNFSADGWYRTGDLVDEQDGFLRITGRVNEIINVGGQKVLPGEVESVLLSAPFVADCIVFGERNPITGQGVCADVVLHPAHKSIDAKREIRRFCRGKLGPHKIPVKVTVVDQLAWNSRFKKTRLRTT
jgi:acyl-CoA synthetase (AMP-forming)/AMP-acid ligase II